MQNTNTTKTKRLSRGVVSEVARTLGITQACAWNRIFVTFHPDAVSLAAEIEMRRKNEINAALKSLDKARNTPIGNFN